MLFLPYLFQVFLTILSFFLSLLLVFFIVLLLLVFFFVFFLIFALPYSSLVQTHIISSFVSCVYITIVICFGFEEHGYLCLLSIKNVPHVNVSEWTGKPRGPPTSQLSESTQSQSVCLAHCPRVFV